MTQSPDTLDPFSEAAILTCCDLYKNSVVGSFHLLGTPDVEVMNKALGRTTDSYPRLMSGVREIWKNGRFQHVWEPRKHLRPVLRTSELDITDGSSNHFDSWIKHTRPRLEVGRDLFHDVASEWHLIRVMQNHYILLAIVHHSAADAEVMAKIGREILANYHEILTGNVAEWAKDGWAWSTSKKMVAKLRKRNLIESFFGSISHISVPGRKAGFPFGSELTTYSDQYLVKRILSRAQSEGIIKESTSMRLSFVDRLVVSAHFSLDQWNAAHGLPTSTIITSIGVNIRHRYWGEHNSNHISYLYFSSNPSDRTKVKEFSRSVARSRIRQLRNHEDLKLYQRFCTRMKIVSVLPFGLRQTIIRSFAQRNLKSVFQINFLGVIWPDVQNGRPTGNSYPIQAGDIEIGEIDAFAFKPATPMPIRMWVYIYRNKLNFVLGWHLKEEDCKPFMELFMKNLINFTI